MKRFRNIHRSSDGGATMSVFVLAAAAFFAHLCALTGCETTEGFGRDMENLGDNIEDAAEENDVE